MDVAYVTDILAMPRPQVTEYWVQVCRCRGCGRRVRGRHAEVGADQYGASAHRMGRRVMAAAHVLHYGVRIPVRRVLRVPTGVELSRSAITQDALRRVQSAVGDAYQRLRESVRESAVERTHLGVETHRQWSDQAIVRTTSILMGLFSWTTLAAHALQDRYPMTQCIAAWYAKPSSTFVDAIALVRRRLWQAAGFCTVGLRPRYSGTPGRSVPPTCRLPCLRSLKCVKPS